jgi:hypothetical protein
MATTRRSAHRRQQGAQGNQGTTSQGTEPYALREASTALNHAQKRDIAQVRSVPAGRNCSEYQNQRAVTLHQKICTILALLTFPQPLLNSLLRLALPPPPLSPPCRSRREKVRDGTQFKSWTFRMVRGNQQFMMANKREQFKKRSGSSHPTRQERHNLAEDGALLSNADTGATTQVGSATILAR